MNRRWCPERSPTPSRTQQPVHAAVLHRVEGCDAKQTSGNRSAPVIVFDPSSSDFNRERPCRWVSPSSVTWVALRLNSSKCVRGPTDAMSASVIVRPAKTRMTLLKRSIPTASTSHLGQGGALYRRGALTQIGFIEK
jgi:hypothetical protein